jgi:beta-aspartyl-peptidase (threonine type)
MTFSLMIHGGAGARRNIEAAAPAADHRAALLRVLEAGRAMLARGAEALDVVEHCVALLEDDPLFNAGRGSVLNADAVVEMDAAVMDGRDLGAGAVAAVRGIANPIRLARRLLRDGRCVLLDGHGAASFAAEQGLERHGDEYFVTPLRLAQWWAWRDRGAPDADGAERGPTGTVGAVARDLQGHLAAATSTGARTGKPAGRIGDSALVGAGLYADDAACAVSCTGNGEDFMRTAVAKAVAERVRLSGLDAEAAADVGMAELGRVAGSGGFILVDRAGACAARFNTEQMLHAWVERGGEPNAVV